MLCPRNPLIACHLNKTLFIHVYEEHYLPRTALLIPRWQDPAKLVKLHINYELTTPVSEIKQLEINTHHTCTILHVNPSIKIYSLINLNEYGNPSLIVISDNLPMDCY